MPGHHGYRHPERHPERAECQAVNELVGVLKRSGRGYGSDTDWKAVKAKSRARAAAREQERLSSERAD
jgi:hypothetical protein